MPHEHSCLNTIQCDFLSFGTSAADTSNDVLVGRPYCGRLIAIIHCVSNNVTPLTCYNHDTHDTITIIFSRSVTEIIRCFAFPPHLCNASALPCKIGNPEDSALVHCACNTDQFLQRSRVSTSFILNHAPNSPEMNALVTGARFMESYSSVNMSRESKRSKKLSSYG